MFLKREWVGDALAYGPSSSPRPRPPSPPSLPPSFLPTAPGYPSHIDALPPSLPPSLPPYLLLVLPPKQGPQPSCFYGPGEEEGNEEEEEEEEEGVSMQGEEWWQHGRRGEGLKKEGMEGGRVAGVCPCGRGQ